VDAPISQILNWPLVHYLKATTIRRWIYLRACWSCTVSEEDNVLTCWVCSCRPVDCIKRMLTRALEAIVRSRTSHDHSCCCCCCSRDYARVRWCRVNGSSATVNGVHPARRALNPHLWLHGRGRSWLEICRAWRCSTGCRRRRGVAALTPSDRGASRVTDRQTDGQTDGWTAVRPGCTDPRSTT